MAQAAGFDFPVMTTADGRPILRYSDLPPKCTPADTDDKGKDPTAEQEMSSSISAKLRAERLKAIRLQTGGAASVQAIPSAVSGQADDIDEEGFLHAAAVGKLPEHLTQTESQDSDSDVITAKQEEEEEQSPELQQGPQQDAKRDKQAAYKPWYDTLRC